MAFERSSAFRLIACCVGRGTYCMIQVLVVATAHKNYHMQLRTNYAIDYTY